VLQLTSTPPPAGQQSIPWTLADEAGMVGTGDWNGAIPGGWDAISGSFGSKERGKLFLNPGRAMIINLKPSVEAGDIFFLSID